MRIRKNARLIASSSSSSKSSFLVCQLNRSPWDVDSPFQGECENGLDATHSLAQGFPSSNSAPCASYMLRKRVLYNDMKRYTCCGGYMPCSGKCYEQKCPEFCLGAEAFCCFSSSVATTRFLLQDEFNIKTTKCDNCIIGFMFFLQQLACICTIIACLTGEEELSDLAQCLNCLSDTVQCTVCACMLTQHKLELDKRDGITDALPAMEAPPVQQMSRVDPNAPPPVAGHPPPPVIVDGYPAPQQQKAN